MSVSEMLKPGMRPLQTQSRSRQASGVPDTRLAGKRILVVEDEVLIALDIVSELRNAGCTPLGPAHRLEMATTLAEAQNPDAAVLDIFLEGAYVWQLARSLSARGVPFIFQTAFGGVLEIPDEFKSAPRLGKPLAYGALKQQLLAIFST